MKNKTKRKINNQSGAAMLISVVFFLFISLAIITGLVSPTVHEFKNASVNLNSKKSYFLSESGIEDALYRIINNVTIGSSENLILDFNSAATTIITNGNTKQITSLGDVKSYQRKTAVMLTSGVGVSFNYGVQVGQGGLEMDNNTTIIGSVYSNGPIIGSNGVKIGGDAFSAGSSGKIEDVGDIDGNATAHFLEDVSIDGSSNSASLLRATVGGNVISDSIANCTIGGNTTYDTKASCTIGGTQTTPNLINFEDPAYEPLPISDDQINAWEDEAVAGGTIGSQTYSGTSNSLGPKKINGNLILDNNAVLTVTGTLWVTGEIKLSNGSTIKLALSYGTSSGVVIAGIDGSSSAGYIEIDNNSQANGSGSAGSYLLMLSQRDNTSSTAIKTSNNGASAILYAGTGVVEIDNNAQLKEVTAYKLKLKNGSDVSYESGLANVNFSSGPSGGYEIESWEETE